MGLVLILPLLFRPGYFLISTRGTHQTTKHSSNNNKRGRTTTRKRCPIRRKKMKQLLRWCASVNGDGGAVDVWGVAWGEEGNESSNVFGFTNTAWQRETERWRKRDEFHMCHTMWDIPRDKEFAWDWIPRGQLAAKESAMVSHVGSSTLMSGQGPLETT